MLGGIKLSTRNIIFSFILLIGTTLLGACSNDTNNSDNTLSKDESETVAKENMPIVEEPINLNFIGGQDIRPADDWNDILVLNEYEDLTNVHIDWELIPSDSIEEKRNLRLGGGDLPDAFYHMGLSQKDLMKYGEQGVFIELSDLIEDYAPNLNALFEEHPEIKKSISMSDGGIYSFPSINDPDFTSMRMAAKPFVNRDWLDELDMDMPETTDEFYEYLTAVKEKDPGNNEGIPYGSPDIDNLLSWLKGSFGVGNLGFANNYFDMDPDNNDELRFYPISDGYKEMLQYTNKLYEEGLIEQSIFSMELDQYLSNAADGKYGSTNWYGPELQFGEGGAPLEGAPALEGPNGNKDYIGISDPVSSLGAFAITSENEHPAATVRWIDYFYGDEGSKLMLMGIEGETYEEMENGEVKYKDYIVDSDESLTDELNKFTIWGGGFPLLFKEEYFFGAETTDQELEATDKLEPDTIETPLPQLPYTSEEMKILNSLGTDIEKYVNEMKDKFIEGQNSFDEWDQYVDTIEKMGLEEYMGIQQDAYERYQSND